MNTDKNTCSLLTYFLEINDLFLLKLKYMLMEQSMEKKISLNYYDELAGNNQNPRIKGRKC